MRRFVKKLLLLSTMIGALFCGVLSPSEASAQPLWKKRREVRKLMSEAQRHQKKGETLDAAKKLKRADKLIPQPSTKRRIAQLLIEMGDLVQAIVILREAIEAKPRSWREKNAVKKSIALLSKTEDRAPTIEVSAFEPEANVMTITIDGEEIGVVLDTSLLTTVIWEPFGRLSGGQVKLCRYPRFKTFDEN